jgi:glycosyltransferase involved in cell wall biosynthesis
MGVKMKKQRVEIVTSYFDGKPFHMKYSGYERMIKYMAADKLYFTLDFKPMSRVFSVLKLARIIPSYYYSFGFEKRTIGDFDVIHHIYPECTFFITGLKGRDFKSKVFITIHKPVDLLEEIMPWNWKSLVDGTNIIVLSKTQYDYFRKEFPDSNVFLIPHGVDVNYFRPKRVKKDEELILSVGDHLRDHDTLLRAMEIVNRVYPKLKLAVVSYNFRSEQKNIVCMNKISDRKLESLYHKALFQVVCVNGFTASNALLESFACGLPCIITDLPDVRFCVNKKGALFYKKGDHRELASRIIELARDRRLRKRLAKEARERALELSWENMSAKIKDAYEKGTGNALTQNLGEDVRIR